jgi:hypothetical protein
MKMERPQAAVREESYLKSLEGIQKLRRFEGDPARFWRVYLSTLLPICEGESGIIAVRMKTGGGAWRLLAVSPDSLAGGGTAEAMMEGSSDIVARCIEKGAAKSENGGGALAVRLQTDSAEDVCIALFFSPRSSQEARDESLRRLALVNDVPAAYQLGRAAAEARTRVTHFAGVLDLMVLLNAEKRFLPAAMAFCNEIATRLGCERVSLGWLEKGYIRAQAISRVDRFERKTEAVQRLEAAMEESLDQNAEIVLPSPAAGGPFRRDHEAYTAALDVAHIVSLPMREAGEGIAVCTCERSTAPFTDTELRLLRLSCDQVSRRLSDLKRGDRWFGARAARLLKEKLAGFLGYEHTTAKVIAVVVAAFLAVVLFGRAPYHINTAANLRTDQMAHLTAPFDGHIEKVFVRIGDNVTRGQQLLSLDPTDLLLREADLVAEKSRYDREVEKAQSSGALADMRIAAALRDQSAARLELARYQLDQAVLRAPFDGTIVEGDLIDRIGSPVRQGEPLFKLGRVENLYAELEVNESDIHEVAADMRGEIALASRPQERFRLQVTRVEPVAIAKEKRNVFIAKAAFAGSSASWWRPGMTGVARLDSGRRTLIWLVTHRTVDFLRLRLWW